MKPDYTLRIKRNRAVPKKILFGLMIGCMLLLFTGCDSKEIAGLDLPRSGGLVSSLIGADQALTAIDAQLVEQKDNYANYYTPQEFQAVLDGITGTYSGIGVYLFEAKDTGATVISSVMKNTPALKAGLQPRDEIIELNGVSLAESSMEEISNKIKGFRAGTAIRLGINRPGEGKRMFDMTTENVEVPTLESVILADGKLGVIKIASFNKNTGAQFVEELQTLLSQDITGLVLDLRDNGGGEVNSALQICDVFVDKGNPLMYITNPTGTFSYTAATGSLDLPVIALQNENSASASEIVLGAIQDSGAGKTLGVTSYGKGLVQEIQPLKSGSAIRVTVSKYATAGDNDIHKVGVKPDYPFPIPEGVSVYASLTLDPLQDPQLAEAIQILLTGKSTAQGLEPTPEPAK